MKNNLGYLSFTLWRALIFFEINDDYALLLKDLYEINCCSAQVLYKGAEPWIQAPTAKDPYLETVEMGI